MPASPSIVTAGLPTDRAARARRIRRCEALLAAAGRPLAAPSANASGRISPTRAEHVLASLGGRIPLIVDGGPTAHGLEITIVAVDRTARRGCCAPARSRPRSAARATATARRIEAPGQLASHYAPAKPLRLNADARRADEWLIGFGAVAGDDNLSASGDLVEAAANLFEALHAPSAAAAAAIAVAPIPDEGLGAAINDRLRRAAAPAGMMTLERQSSPPSGRPSSPISNAR